MNEKSKKPNRYRSHDVKIRMNDEEYTSFLNKVKMSGQSRQSFILNAIDKAVIPSKETTEELIHINREIVEMQKQIRGIAVNVNQMAHNSNLEILTGLVHAENHLLDIQKDISVIKKESTDLWLSLRRLMAKNRLMQQ